MISFQEHGFMHFQEEEHYLLHQKAIVPVSKLGASVKYEIVILSCYINLGICFMYYILYIQSYILYYYGCRFHRIQTLLLSSKYNCIIQIGTVIDFFKSL